MCDIDRELVLRGAAYFATYAAEREPPRPDEFTAALIAKALRHRVASPAPAVVSAPPEAPSTGYASLGRRQREITKFLRKRTSGATRAEIADALGIKNGNVAYFMGSLITKKVVSQDSQGRLHIMPGIGPVEDAPPPAKGAGRARELLEETKSKHSRVEEPTVRVFTLLRERGESITPTEISKLAKVPNPNTSGSLHAMLGRLIKQGLVEKVSKGLYQATAKGLS